MVTNANIDTAAVGQQQQQLPPPQIQHQPQQPHQQQMVPYTGSPAPPSAAYFPSSPGSDPAPSGLHALVMHFVPVGEFGVPGIDNGLNDGDEGDVENDRVGNALLAQANKLGLCQPPGSEEVLADSGASGTYINGDAHMFDTLRGNDIPTNQRYVQVGSGQMLRVAARGSLIFDFHQWNAAGLREDVRVFLPNVLAVEGFNFNLLSLHEVSAHMPLMIDVKGVHLAPLDLTFPRNQSWSSLFVTRVNVSEITTALPMFVGRLPGSISPPEFPPPSVDDPCVDDGCGGVPMPGFPPVGQAGVVLESV